MNEPGKAAFGQEGEDLAGRYVGVGMTQAAVEVDADFNESTWKPPLMYAYVDSSGKAIAVDQTGSPLPSPPLLSLVDPASGAPLGNHAVDPWGNAVPLYQPPISGVQAYVAADGTVKAADASGTPLASPPDLSAVDPATGGPLAQLMVLDPLTHQPLLDSNGDPVTIPTVWPPPGPPPATWPPAEEETSLDEDVPETALGDDVMSIEEQEETIRSDIPTVEPGGIVRTAVGEDAPPEAVGEVADGEANPAVQGEEIVSVTGLGSEELGGVLGGGATAITPGVGERGPVRGMEAEVIELGEEIPELKWDAGLAVEDLSNSQVEYVKAEIEGADINGEESARFGIEMVKAGIEEELIGQESAVAQATEFTLEVVEADSLEEEHAFGGIGEEDALVDDTALLDRDPSPAEEGFGDNSEIDL